MSLGEPGADLREQIVHLIRLDGQDDLLGGFEDVRVEGSDLRAGFIGEMAPGGLEVIAGDHIAGRDQPRLGEAFREGRGHLARAQETDLQIGSHARVVAAHSPE